VTKKLFLTVAVAALALMVAGCGDDEGTQINGPVGLLGLAIPEGTVIESATLNLYVWQLSDQTVNTHRITADWDEMTVTWGNFGGAYDGAIESSFLVDAEGWVSTDATSLVQAWLDGTYPNYGFLLEQGFTWPRSIWFSRDYGSVAPYLEVCYYFEGDLVCETFESIADSYIWELNPDDNFGAVHVIRSGHSSETELEKQALVRFEIPTEPPPPPPDGCTRTIGFWKTHAGFGPQDDEVSQYLPILLGDAGGTKTRTVATAQDAVDYLNQDVYGKASNGITKLYAQLLGAKLNVAAGASSPVDSEIAAADAFLADYDYMDWKSLTKDQKDEVNDLKSTLDDYNNGLLGTLHCD